MDGTTLIVLMAAMLGICLWLLLRKPKEAETLAVPLQGLTQAIQSLAKDTAVLTEQLQKIDSDQARISGVLQDVQNGVIGTSRDTQGLLKTTDEMRQHLGDAKIGLSTLHTITKERQEDERLMSESVRRLESVIAGTQSKGAAGENILDMVFSRLPADWQVRNFKVEGKVCEFGLRLPNKRIMPIDSKWTATSLLERFTECEEIGGRQRIKADIEKAVLRKAEEVRKYLDPETTCGFGVAVVPDAIYDLCGATLCQVFEMRVAIISYSMFVPYLLLVFQTNLKTSVDIDLHKLSHAVSESEKSIKAIQDKLDGTLSKSITQIVNSRDDVKREAANVAKLLNSIQRDSSNYSVNTPAIALTIAEP